MRYLITFSYDGSKFEGYQKQKSLITVQGEIEKVLTQLNGKYVSVFSSGRTDKGVHAINQKAHFDLNINIKLYSIKNGLNRNLNNIYIKDIQIVNSDFHARYSVKKKTYCYYINTSDYNVFQSDYVYQYNKPLNIDSMVDAIRHLVGEHDFRGFCKDEKDKVNCIRTIYDAHIEVNNNIISIYFTGNGFLRKMVRNIVGLLIEIGSNKKEPNSVNAILLSEGKIHNTKSVCGCGLYLYDVFY